MNNDFIPGVCCGLLVAGLFITAIAFLLPITVQTFPIALKTQNCIEIYRFKEKSFILCPGECERNKDLELCFKPEKEQENE